MSNAGSVPEVARAFLRKLELQLTVQGIDKSDDVMYKRALAFTVDGDGKQWVVSHILKQKLDWEAAKVAFLDHFAPNQFNDTAWDRLYAVKHTGSMREYCDAISLRVYEADVNSDSAPVRALFPHTCPPLCPMLVACQK